MEIRTVSPKRLLTYRTHEGSLDLDEEKLTSVLPIYFDIFRRKYGRILPPTLAIRADLISEESRNLRLQESLKTIDSYRAGRAYPRADTKEQQKGEMETAYKTFTKKIKNKFYIVGDISRALAATLARKPIKILNIETDEDLDKVHDIDNPTWDLLGLESEEHHIQSVAEAWERRILSPNLIEAYVDGLKTLKDVVDELITTERGPIREYMIDIYVNGNTKPEKETTRMPF